jgi:hypothetical protein
MNPQGIVSKYEITTQGPEEASEDLKKMEGQFVNISGNKQADMPIKKKKEKLPFIPFPIQHPQSSYHSILYNVYSWKSAVKQKSIN